MDGRKLSAYAGRVSPTDPTSTLDSPWIRSLAVGAGAGVALVAMELTLALAWPAPAAALSVLDVALALAVSVALGMLGGLLARLLWRQAPAAVAWVPLAALLAPQLLRPLDLSYSWDPVLSGTLVLAVFVLPRASAGLSALVMLAVPVAVALGLDRGQGGEVPDSPLEVEGPDILLITVDTLRADAGLKLPEPHAWRVYEQAVSAAPWTLPAMISLFSGTPVREHLGGLPAQQGGGYTRPDAGSAWLPVTLAEWGYSCAAFTSNPYLTPTFGFEQGFEGFVHADAFREPFLARRGMERLVHQLTGRVERLRRERDERVVRAVVAYLAEPSPTPRFTWVHLLAPHEYSRDIATPVTGWRPNTEDPALLRRAYAANVTAAERHIAELISAVDPSTTVVAFTADHGEQLGEDGVFGHGLSLGDRELRVPLALRGPGMAPGRVGAQVSVSDLAAALLAVAQGKPVALVPRTQAPVGGLRSRNKAGTFAFRGEEVGDSAVYEEDLNAIHRARMQRDGPLITPDESTRRALEALGYVE